MIKFKTFLKVSTYLLFFTILLCPPISMAAVKIGVIYTGYFPYYRKMHYAFAKELIKNLPRKSKVKYIRQRPFPDPMAWSNAARKLVVHQVDLIVAYGLPATEAVLLETNRIPIIYAGVYKPDTLFTENNKNSTGCGYKISFPTLLNHFAKTNPITKLNIIYTHNEADTIHQVDEIEKLAKEENIAMVKWNIAAEKDIEQLHNISDGDSLIITGSAFAHTMIESIMSIVQTKNVTTLDIFPGSEEHGVLMCYYQDPEEMGAKAAELAAKILIGYKPDQVEPILLSNSNLILNAKEAKRLKCQIPEQLARKATAIID